MTLEATSLLVDKVGFFLPMNKQLERAMNLTAWTRRLHASVVHPLPRRHLVSSLGVPFGWLMSMRPWLESMRLMKWDQWYPEAVKNSFLGPP